MCIRDRDYTGKLEINDGSLYLKGVALRNGTHTLTVRLKDFYGNVTTETRTCLLYTSVPIPDHGVGAEPILVSIMLEYLFLFRRVLDVYKRQAPA